MLLGLGTALQSQNLIHGRLQEPKYLACLLVQLEIWFFQN